MFAQLNTDFGGLNDLNTTNLSPPRNTDCWTERISSAPSYSSSSSQLCCVYTVSVYTHYVTVVVQTIS
nr:MAG TPA: hypothetical protein [Caudoviricetes sp.]